MSSGSSKSSCSSSSVKLFRSSYIGVNLSEEVGIDCGSIDCVGVEYEVDCHRWGAWKRMFSSRIVAIWEKQGNVIWTASKG